jgi:hypothetical protein
MQWGLLAISADIGHMPPIRLGAVLIRDVFRRWASLLSGQSGER